MKVIKRDGRAVDFDRKKISIAIEKANTEVKGKEKATKQEIENIIEYIEDIDKKRILVEDIQDIIEQKLMEIKKYDLAKKYIVYRYTRALVRKQNTTDESILGLIKRANIQVGLIENNDRNGLIASAQRDLIAGEVSKDLTKRILLPDKISKANSEGEFYFHDAEYFIQPLINTSFIKVGDMLDNGTVLNNIRIETPKTFRTACNVLTQIICITGSNQYGEVYIDSKHLGKYLRKSKETIVEHLKKAYENDSKNSDFDEHVKSELEKELFLGIQALLYQLNIFLTSNGHTPYITIFLNLEEKDSYYEENSMIIKELLKQFSNGVLNENEDFEQLKYPKLTYVIQKDAEDSELTNYAKKCSEKNDSIIVITPKEFKEFQEGMFDQGIVTINLPQIGIISEGNEKEFWKLFDERLELCKEALMYRHYALLGTYSDISPIHWQYGAIARMNHGEKIDRLLRSENSKLYLGYVGIPQVFKILKGNLDDEKEKQSFESKIIKNIKEKLSEWKKDTGIGFNIYKNTSTKIGDELARIDREIYKTIPGVNDKEYSL